MNYDRTPILQPKILTVKTESFKEKFFQDENGRKLKHKTTFNSKNGVLIGLTYLVEYY